MNLPAVIVGSASVLCLSGCVVEKQNKPKTGITYAPQAQSQRGVAVPPPELPKGPIATPANAPRTSARVLVQIDPLTTVTYDGQVLPIVSPDGRFIAVEDGEPPTWPTILAQPGAHPPEGTHLAVYNVSAAPPQERTEIMSYPTPLPRGLLLGRSCDNQGFLVEAPRSDGSRWIGKVMWITGQLQWLVQGDAVNAHAVYSPQGHLIYTSRGVNSEKSDLIMISAGGGESRRSGEVSYLFPVTTGEKDVVYAMSLGAVGLEVEAIRIVDDPPGSHHYRLGVPLAREFIGRPGDPALAYQVTAMCQNAIVMDGKIDESVTPAPLAIYHPRLDRMATFDTQASTFVPLAAKSVAAIRWSESPDGGYLCTTPQGLMFTRQPLPGATLQRSNSDIRLDQVAYVPRGTASVQTPVILIGPPLRNPAGKLDIRRLKVVSEDKFKEAAGNAQDVSK